MLRQRHLAVSPDRDSIFFVLDVEGLGFSVPPSLEAYKLNIHVFLACQKIVR